MINRIGKPRIGVLTGSDVVGLGIKVVLSVEEFEVALIRGWAELDAHRPKLDILFVDDYMSADTDLLSLLGRLKTALPTTKFVVVASRCDHTQIWLALQHHVNGYLCLADGLEERLLQVVRDVSSGGLYLSPTTASALATMQYFQTEVHQRLNSYHREVLRLMLCGWGVEQIAQHLGRSTQAIYHVQRHLRVLFDVETNIQLLQCTVRLGFGYPPDDLQEDSSKNRL